MIASSHKRPGVDWLCWSVGACMFSVTQTTQWTVFHFQQQFIRIPIASYAWQHLICQNFNLCQFGRCEIFLCNFNLHFPNDKSGWNFFHTFLGHFYFFFVNTISGILKNVCRCIYTLSICVLHLSFHFIFFLVNWHSFPSCSFVLVQVWHSTTFPCTHLTFMFLFLLFKWLNYTF